MRTEEKFYIDTIVIAIVLFVGIELILGNSFTGLGWRQIIHDTNCMAFGFLIGTAHFARKLKKNK